MPARTCADDALSYHLICYDRHGVERTDDPDAGGGQLSAIVHDQLEDQSSTDVFIFTHGWLNDVDTAAASYDQWLGAVLRSEEDLEAVRRARPGFRPLLIGVHWPSCPFGNERLESQVSFGTSAPDPLTELLQEATETLGGNDAAEAALNTIFQAALEDIVPDEMSPEVADAYQTLWESSGLSFEGPAGAPGADAQSFDPEGLYEESLDGELAFGGSLLGGLLAPLRPLSFWKMKQRARHFGEIGGASLLRSLMDKAAPDTRFHLMGHSFGCIVAAAMVAGAGGDHPLPRPVDTLFLAQGAVSCWSFAPRIPIAQGKPGYFSSIATQAKVGGAFVTTQSQHDSAVGTAYPLATSSRQVSFTPGAPASRQPPPPDGSLGTFGVRGDGLDAVSQPMLPHDATYDFEAGKIYNLDGSQFICEGRIPFLGAHCDIAKPEVAHALWSAVLTPR